MARMAASLALLAGTLLFGTIFLITTLQQWGRGFNMQEGRQAWRRLDEKEEDGLLANGTLELEDSEEDDELERIFVEPSLQLLRNISDLDAPDTTAQYDGISLQSLSVGGGSRIHVFAIGDWGAILPTHYTAPNSRPMGSHHRCPDDCPYVYGIDDRAQSIVAEQVIKRAATSNPQYFLNVGDSLYWGGLSGSCGAGTKQVQGNTVSEFSQVWQSMYGDLTNKPWISTLGNHDYGGYIFTAPWDQMIAYSFYNPNWVMPARYFRQRMQHEDFSVDYFVIDSNAFDAKDPGEDPEHNICGATHNAPGASCGSVGGPDSLEQCKAWFWDSYMVQKQWLEQELQKSDADWKVVVTHFPCGYEAGWFAHLHQQYGLDLLVTGHRHDQELFANWGALGGMTCFVTGGGGGITSELTPDYDLSPAYGFFDLTISKSEMRVELINFKGHVLDSTVVYPMRQK